MKDLGTTWCLWLLSSWDSSSILSAVSGCMVLLYLLSPELRGNIGYGTLSSFLLVPFPNIKEPFHGIMHPRPVRDLPTKVPILVGWSNHSVATVEVVTTSQAKKRSEPQIQWMVDHPKHCISTVTL